MIYISSANAQNTTIAIKHNSIITGHKIYVYVGASSGIPNSAVKHTP